MQGFCILFSLIAREVGFTAPNLREQFKRKYGMTPTDIISASNDDPGYNLNADIVLKLHSQDGTLKQNVFPLVSSTTMSKTSTFYLAVPSLNVASKITFEATIGEDTYTYEKEDVTIAPSKYYQCTLTMTKTAGTY